jgi:hypothetical protein
MSEFWMLVAAIYIADALFEITRLAVEGLAKSRRPLRDSRGRFASPLRSRREA